MAAKKTKQVKAKPQENSLAAWSEIIKRQGEESRERENARKVEVAAYLSDLRERDRPFFDHVKLLIQSHDAGFLRVDELLAELRNLTV